jgi:hypothetical protein
VRVLRVLRLLRGGGKRRAPRPLRLPPPQPLAPATITTAAVPVLAVVRVQRHGRRVQPCQHRVELAPTALFAPTPAPVVVAPPLLLHYWGQVRDLGEGRRVAVVGVGVGVVPAAAGGPRRGGGRGADLVGGESRGAVLGGGGEVRAAGGDADGAGGDGRGALVLCVWGWMGELLLNVCVRSAVPCMCMYVHCDL